MVTGSINHILDLSTVTQEILACEEISERDEVSTPPGPLIKMIRARIGIDRRGRNHIKRFDITNNWRY